MNGQRYEAGKTQINHIFMVFLRFWLWRSRTLPWNLVAFLDEAAMRLLLYKAGGSYLFVHRLLLEYLALLKSPLLSETGIQLLDEDTLTNNDE